MTEGDIGFRDSALVAFATAYSAGYDDGFKAGMEFTDDGGSIIELNAKISDLERRIEFLQRKISTYSIALPNESW